MRSVATCAGVLALALSLSGTVVVAQQIPRASIEDKVLGWIKIYDYKAPTLPVKADGRVYSPAQLSIGQLFARWMQASYQPVGSLGDVLLTRNVALNPYNQNTAALPQSYGAFAKLYIELKYDANRKIVPFTNSHVVWTMEANGFYGIPAEAISTPERYYFTLPTFAQQTSGDGALEKAADVSGHPVLGQFPAFFMRNSVTGNRKYVLLSKDRRLPFVKVTRGQYLDAVEVAIARARAEELRKLTQANQGNQKEIDRWMTFVDERTAKRMAVLQQNREKYKARLQETAEISTDQPDVMFENYPDVFERNGGSSTRLPVYTIDPALAELCKTDAPQWIVVSWTAHLNDPASRNLHQAILHNVDFAYIYNYFFDPAKVKGQPYKPLGPPANAEVPR